jgi:predicted PurR-regulated permease PerM
MSPDTNPDRFRKTFLLLLVVGITAAFVAMVRQFLLLVLLAAIFAGLAYPLYDRLVRAFRGRRALASAVTLLLLLVVIVGPAAMLAGVVASEAIRVTRLVQPTVQGWIENPGDLFDRLRALPGAEQLEPYRSQALQKLGELVGRVGNWLFESLSAGTRGTLSFFVQFALLLYTMFFFFLDGPGLLRKILWYLPLPHEDEVRMVDRFVSVTRATLKGTLVIGIVQGALGGLAFAVAGIPGAVFWGTVMVVVSIIPGLGIALVWGPAAIILASSGRPAAAIGLAAFCAVVAGSVDNVLRPRLVGRDTQMHDLLILFATIGGLMMFGLVGFIVGPILAALFVTVWDIYGVVFQDALPAVGSLDRRRRPSGEKADTDPETDESRDADSR